MPEHRNNENVIAALIERLAQLMRASEHDAGMNPAQWVALRYLARCNRFSNSPGALAAYLAATKGTVSQTILALQRKGLIAKTARPGKGRSVAITLTPEGKAVLARDPWRLISDRILALAERERGVLNDTLFAIVAGVLAENQLNTFGVCRSCRFFKPGGMNGDQEHPHRCGLLNVTLERSDAHLICAEHKPSAAAGG
jgi:DNA-binding MarR family transcriptional regulator